MPLQEANRRSLWDPHNTISPLRTDASQRTALQALQALHEAMVEEAGRLGEAETTAVGHSMAPQ